MTTFPTTLIRDYSKPVPRYTSYPTAPNFTDAVDDGKVASWLGELDPLEPISLYLHIPYCDRLCWFCACHTKHTLRYEPIQRYIDQLVMEINLVSRRIGRRQKVDHIHLGGGSPSLLRERELVTLRAALETCFDLADSCEISLEFDPTDMNTADVDRFISFGVTRASLGVQDFDERVQTAINRPQSLAKTREVIDALRDRGVSSVNIDALYGLPFQTDESLRGTIDQVVALQPDRIALFGYAHVPWAKPHQRMIEETSLPDTIARFRQAVIASSILERAGYEKLGIDHFALPDDALAKAARAGNLRRNFQGYTTDGRATLIGLGTSAISQFPQGYAQNSKSVPEYARALADDRLPTERGVALTATDRVTAAAIEQLMCNFRIDSDALRERFGQEARSVLRKAAMTVSYDEDGLFEADDQGFQVTELGRPFVRVIASCLDDYFAGSRLRYSAAI